MRHGRQKEGGRGFQEDKAVLGIKNFCNFLKIGARPINIAYPLPLTSFLAFSLSSSGLFEFLVSYIFCFFFFTAVNLWNHLNDAEDDARAGKDHVIFLMRMRKEATIFSILFYFFSASMLIFSKDFISIPLFLICALFTWIYSDKLFFGKKFKRLKEDYRTELLTYLIVTPSFPAMLWTFFAQFSVTAIVFSLLFALLYLSGVLLKDLKDITEDATAGYKTLAVVFSPKDLFKFSALIMVSTILLIPIFSFLSLLPIQSSLTALMLIPVLYSISSIKKRDWELSIETIKAIRMYTLSYPLIVFLLATFSLKV